jgi:hypothetical protein
MADATNDRLPSTASASFGTGWDWKNQYVSSLAEEGYERFSQFSASPSSTVLLAGPARFTGLSGGAADLIPIGLTDGISMQSNPQLQQLFEIGSDRSFFTRGKTTHSLSLGKMLADQKNILAALSANAYRPAMLSTGMGSPSANPNPDIMMNLDSEYFAVPFGLMLIFKTRGGGTTGSGKPLSALYLEYCMFANYQFSIANASPVIQEGISVTFDRPVPVALA